MSIEPFFVPGKRKYLFCTDEEGLEIFQPLIEKVKTANVCWEVFALNKQWEPLKISDWFNKQQMGSFLYASCDWISLKNVKQMAEEAGFSGEEAQYVGHGKQHIKVFCCRCHGISILEKEASEISCSCCGLLLSVTDHFSSLWDAYLGFVAKL